MTRLKRLPPELVSFLAGLIAIAGSLLIPGYPLLLAILFKGAASIFVAYFFYLHKRPTMWSHLWIQFIVLILILIFALPSTPLTLIVFIPFALLSLVPDVIICGAYTAQFRAHLAAADQDEGSENE